MNYSTIFVFFVLFFSILTQDLIINMTYPTTFNQAVTYVGADSYGDYRVFFKDGTYYKYNSDLALVDQYYIGISV